MSTRPTDRHPLLPGVRCAEVWDRDWPRVLHDKQLTGFSPLHCGMGRAPAVWAEVEVGGELAWVRFLDNGDLLIDDGRLRALSAAGQVRWESPVSGDLLYAGRLRGGTKATGPDLLVGRANRLFLVDGATGATLWQHAFEPPHVRVRTAVGPMLPGRNGLQVAVFMAYGEAGCLLDFGGGPEPDWVWERPVVVDGEWPERADHGCAIQLDLSVPDEPLIWNLRHHRCRAFDPRTGDVVSSLVYDLGNGRRRNYGPWSFGVGRGGEPYICVVAERVQTHVHALRLSRSGPAELAWQRYYGEVYVVPGVAVERAAVADLDGDGATEVAYTVRDPERGFRSFVRLRRVDTGEVAAEIGDARCLGAVPGLGRGGEWGLVVEADEPDGDGLLTLTWLTAAGRLESVPLPAGWRPWGAPGPGAHPAGQLLLCRASPAAVPAVARCAWGGDGLEVRDVSADPGWAGAALRLVVPQGAASPLVCVEAAGQLSCRTWDGTETWRLPLTGGPRAAVSAADLDGDGRAELAAALPGGRLQVLRCPSSGPVQVLTEMPFHGQRSRLSPLLYDLTGSGRLDIVCPDRTDAGQPLVRAWRGDGELLWETSLPVPAAAGAALISWNVGDFLGPGRPAVAVSVADPPRTVEGTFLLDGADGRILWHRDRLEDGAAIRGFYPAGLPTAFDVDGDGAEEIGIDCLSYLGYVRGRDGTFALLHHSPNIRAEGALYAAQLYNSFCPVYRGDGDDRPHWFAPLGHGTFGLMHPDPATGVWREEVGYEVPPRAGLVDVDGDGRLEVGYALLNHSTFVCRDLWTGAEKWRLDLPEPPDSPVLAADVDGDGRGEFLVGRWCLGTDDAGRGQVRWEAPVPLGWAAIADVDGDGLGEIVCAGPGRLYVLKGAG